MATWSIVYFDGSANAYRVNSDGSFEYDPVTPERSSTGFYSGGDPRRAQLEPAQLGELWQRARALEAATEQHTEDRAKGTGAFTIRDEAGERSFIVKRGADLLAFDEAIGALGR